MHRSRKGFTLIEMLVVIAIIAILVSVIVPVLANSVRKSQAATDAANLRTVLGLLNIAIANGETSIQDVIDNVADPTSKMNPDAILYAVFETPGFIDVYYVSGNTYYSLPYLSELSVKGESSISTAKPEIEGVWYTATVTP